MLSPQCHHTTNGCHYPTITLGNGHLCWSSWIQSLQPGMGWFPTLPADKEAQTWVCFCHLCPQHLPLRTVPALPCRQGEHSTARMWAGAGGCGVIPSHRDGALGMLLMGQSSAEAECVMCWCWDLRPGGKSLSSSNGTSLGVSWSRGTLLQGRLVPLVEGQGGGKVMSCSRATTAAL